MTVRKMISQEEFVQLCHKLTENPSLESWKEFASNLRDTKLKYYSVTFKTGNVDTEQDLLTSNAVLFDEEGNEVTSVPIYVKDRGNIKGALFYLRGLTRMNGRGTK